MRYFLITFSLRSGPPNAGSLCIEREVFPSKSYIKHEISEQLDETTDITILSIFEFKNEIDYKNYNS